MQIQGETMPEGPEIRLAADKVEKALKGQALTEVYFAFEHLQHFAKQFTGATVTGLETRGKALLTHTDQGLTIYSHNQLYGRWMVRKSGELPNTSRQLRLALHNTTHSAYLFSASDIEVLETANLLLHPFLARIGPDILGAGADDIKTQIHDPRFARRRLGHLLLDQAFLAGMGNYLRSEALFVAGLDPLKRPVDCSDEELDSLAETVCKLARQSYRHGGITNDLTLARQLKSEGVPRREFRHWVFSREGKACHRCGDPVRKISVATRRLYYCGHCQPPA
jgi:endonuclease-8